MLPCKKRKIVEPQNTESNTKIFCKDDPSTADRGLGQFQTNNLSPDRTGKPGTANSAEDPALTGKPDQVHETGLERSNPPRLQSSHNTESFIGTSSVKQDNLPPESMKNLGGMSEISRMIAKEKKISSECRKDRRKSHHGKDAGAPGLGAVAGNTGKSPKSSSLDCEGPSSVKDTSDSRCWSLKQKQVVPVKRSLNLGNSPLSGAESPSSIAYLLSEDDMEFSEMVITLEEDEDSSPEKKKRRRKKPASKWTREDSVEPPDAVPGDVEMNNMLEMALEDRAKLHNLTATNVRNILHEVITNEHVVAMMKAAINETEEVPMFEPKMTRSKLKEVVEKGVVIPSWNLTPVKKVREMKPLPQFVDIPLADEDSSDEEYQPDEDEEDETAEESFLESDVESTASSPRVPKHSKHLRTSEQLETDEEGAATPERAEKASGPSFRHIRTEPVPMGPPPPPKPKVVQDTVFMEKLHAVDEELASVSTEAFEPLEESLIACRTRSKRTLKDVPIGQLEAELCAPDATPDMYEPNTADDEDWKLWLQGLMNDDMGNEDEGDDEDDPEYNFLEDLDVPDIEDLRNDRAVRITKKEVNQLMEELFDTFQEDSGIPSVTDDGQEDDDGSGPDGSSDFNTPEAIRFEEPLANMLSHQHNTVKQQLKLMRMKRSVMKQDGTIFTNEKPVPILILNLEQKKRLQQQMQQHVQLLTQMHLLCSINSAFNTEAHSSSIFLIELSSFATNSLLLRRPFTPDFQTSFQTCNLKDALQFVLDFHTQVPQDWSPSKDQTQSMTKKGTVKYANDLVCLPKQLAWMMATRKLFMYPELLPICSMRTPTPNDKPVYTKAEDNLLALGLKHFEGTENIRSLISKYLLVTKTPLQISVRIKNLSYSRVPDNVVRFYKKTKRLPRLFRCCDDVDPASAKPPVEREEHRLPFWLKASLTCIHEAMRKWKASKTAEEKTLETSGLAPDLTTQGTKKLSSEAKSDGQKYPLIAPADLELTLKPLRGRVSMQSWRPRRALLKPILMKTTTPTPTAPYVTGKQKPLSRTMEHPGIRLNLQSLNIPPPMFNKEGQAIRVPLATLTTDAKLCQPAPILRTIMPIAPVYNQPKMALPALPPRYRKPRKRRARPMKKAVSNATFVMKPFLHSAPLIFTIPAGALELVSVGNGCSLVQPISTLMDKDTQRMPVTMLLNANNLIRSTDPVIVSSHVPESNAAISQVGSSRVQSECLESLHSTCEAADLDCENPTVPNEEPNLNLFGGGRLLPAEEEGCPSKEEGLCPTEKEEPRLSEGDRPHLSEGDRPHLSEGDRPHLSEGDRPHLSEGDRPHLSEGDLPHLSEGDRSHLSDGDWLQPSNKDQPRLSNGDQSNFSSGDLSHPSSKDAAAPQTNIPYPSSTDCPKTEEELDSKGPAEVDVKEEKAWCPSEEPLHVAVKEESLDSIKKEGFGEVLQGCSPVKEAMLGQDPHSSKPDQECVLDPSRKQDVEALLHSASKDGAHGNKDKSSLAEPVDKQVPGSEERQHDVAPTASEAGQETNMDPSSNDGSTDQSRPPSKPEDGSSANGQSGGTAAGTHTGGEEKDAQEEEEEEDFDDLTQDEDEEMSSASEESVLSVPELQETMEKLTWLASESHLSQEGESEEENSQEDNSEPEEEEEEEGEGDGTAENLNKDEDIADPVAEDAVESIPASLPIHTSPPKVPTREVQQVQRVKGTAKARSTHRSRGPRGRARTSKDTAKLLLLCDENILQRDPLREQKDMAFAQAYLSRVREALKNVPGKYEAFLHIIYEFEMSQCEGTAVDLYSSLQNLLLDYPQLLKDFAAFLLPEQALECGLFEEQQAFDKSRKFLRQLEICFAENPSHHQKIIKVLQGCAECLPEEIAELKTQMCQLLKGHDHLLEEFSMFFDHLRPPASRMGDFEVINWTEEKEYEFDGFEEVSLPDVEEEDETPKIPAAPRSKRRKDTGGAQSHDKEVDATDSRGTKVCPCSCHQGVTEHRQKKSKRKTCGHCNCKVCDVKSSKSKDAQEVAVVERSPSQAERKDVGSSVTVSKNCQDKVLSEPATGVQTRGIHCTQSEELPGEKATSLNKEDRRTTEMRASTSSKRHASGVHRPPTMGRNDVLMKMPQKPPDPGAPQPGKGDAPAAHSSHRTEDNHARVMLGWEKASNSKVNLLAPATLLVEPNQHIAPFQTHSSIGHGPSHLSPAPLALASQMCAAMRTIAPDSIQYPSLVPGTLTHSFEVNNFHKTFGSLNEMPAGLSTVTAPPGTQCTIPVTPTTLGPVLVSPAALNTVPVPAPALGASTIFGAAQVPYSTLGAMPLPSAVLGTMLVPSAILSSVPGNSTTLGTMPSTVLITGPVPSANLGTGAVPATAVSTVPVFSAPSARCTVPVTSASLISLSAPSVTFCNNPVQSFAFNTTPVSCDTISTQSVHSATFSTMPIPSVTLSPTLIPSAVPLATTVSTTINPSTASNTVLSPSTALNTSPVPSVTLSSTQVAVSGLPNVKAPCTTCGSSPVQTSNLVSTSILPPTVTLGSQLPSGSIDTLLPSVDTSSNEVQSLGLSSTHVPLEDIGVLSVIDSGTQIPSVDFRNTQVPSGNEDSFQVAEVDSLQETPADHCSTHVPPADHCSTHVPSAGLCSTQVASADIHSTLVPSQSPSGFSNTKQPSVDHNTTQISSPSCSSLVPFATIGNLRLPSDRLGPQVLYATISSTQATSGGVINLQIPPGTYINFQVPPGSLSRPLQATTDDSKSQKPSSEHELLQAVPGSPGIPQETLMDIDNALPGSPISLNVDPESYPAPISARGSEELAIETSPNLDQQVSEMYTAQSVDPVQWHSEGTSKHQDSVSELAVCAKNSKVSSTGEKVVLWTREADRVILTTCQEQGAHQETFSAISGQLGHKTPSEISRRFRELMRLFHTSCDVSSEEEEDATSTSNTDQLSDRDLQLSEEEQDE